MRKRNDVSKAQPPSPAGLRSSTRNSAAVRRGEERLITASKEQNKSPPTVSKAAEEKASVITSGSTPLKRSNSKKETLVATEAMASETTVPLINDPPETSQPEREIASIETCMEGMEKKNSETLMPESVEANSGPLPEKLEAVDDGPVQSYPESLKLEMETWNEGLTQSVGENTDPNEAGVSSKYQTEAGELTEHEQEKAGKSPEAGELSWQDQDRVAKAPTSATKTEDLSGHNQDRAANDPAVGAEAEDSSGQDQARSAEAPAFGTEAGEMPGQEEERAAKAPASGMEESLTVAGGEITTPPKELSVSPSHPQVMVETEQNDANCALPSNAEENTPHSLGSDDPACVPANYQQVQGASNPPSSQFNMETTSPAATVELNGSLPQEVPAISDVVANTSFGKDHEISNPLIALEADKATDKGPGPDAVKKAPSFFHVENSFGNNMVSFVEGETVLIVENLGLSSHVPTKLNENMSGAMGEVNDLQKEADAKVHSGSMLGVGKDLVGMTFKKKFGKKFFEGKVVEYEPELNWYKVMYEDGDEEELDLKEVQRLLLSDEAEDDEQPNKRKHRRISSIPNSLKRSAAKAKRPGSPGFASSDDDMEDDTQVEERVKLRGYKKRLVIDTSNDGNVDSLDSDNQLSTTSDDDDDEDDDDDDDEDEPVPGKRNSTRKMKHNIRGKRRKRADDKSEEEFTALQSRLSTRVKEESLVKSHETPAEHRIATRRSSHRTSSDDYSSASLKKPQGDFQDKLRPESPASEVSPLGGGAKLIGRKTKKDFGGQFYIGEIVHYDNRVKYYKVRYEDGDEEELEWGELAPTLLPQEGHHHVLALEAPHEATSRHSQGRFKEHTRRGSTTKSKEGAIILYDGGASNGDLASSTRKWRKKVRTASVSVMMKGMDSLNAASTSAAASEPPPRPLAAVRFASASDADVFEYYAWGEAVNFDRSKCPELRATRLLPSSSPVVHLAASRHHLVALTAAGQVWVWRCKHGSIHTRCNEWEHVALLDNRNVILVDISGPDVDRAAAGYQPAQEDQVPDPFYLAAVCSNGEDIILQGSQPHESVHTYQYDNEPQHPGLRDSIMQSNPGWIENVGYIVQVSVGMVEAADESPFVGYITDSDCVFIRSATRDYVEEVNLVTGYTGKPLKIQCGRVYHAIIMTDDGRAWTWGQGYYPGSNLLSAGFASKSTSPFSVCQPAVGTLVGRKVVDVGCYGEDFIALTNDGDVHQWTHTLPNPAAGVYNVPATPVNGQGPSIVSADKLKQVAIGAGICAGISESGKVHTWRTSLKGGFVGTVGLEREALTPLGRDEGYTETAILSLGTRAATKVMCVAGSLLVVVKRKYRGRRGGRRKVDPSMKGKMPEDEGAADS